MADYKKSVHVHCFRYTLVLLHVFFMIVGLFLLMLSIWVREIPGTNYAIEIATSSITQDQIDWVCYIAMAVAAAVILVSLIGFCGTLNNDKRIFFILGFIMAVLIIAELVVGIFSALLQEKMRVRMLPEMSHSLSLYAGDNEADSVSAAWSEAQMTFQCCGVNTEAGYRNHSNVEVAGENETLLIGSKWYREVGTLVGKEWPESCCKKNRNTNIINMTACYEGEFEGLYKKGCQTEIYKFLRNHFILFGVLCGLLIIFQIVGIAMSFQMFKYSKKRKSHSSIH